LGVVLIGKVKTKSKSQKKVKKVKDTQKKVNKSQQKVNKVKDTHRLEKVKDTH